jgi:allantoin racemase
MSVRIAYLNPVGTDIYNDLMRETLLPFASHGTELSVLHLPEAPPDIDLFASKHLMELAVLRSVSKLEADGFDAVIVGCCYDPAVLVSREVVDIPVIGPLEASVALAPYFGRTFSLVGDSWKAIAWIKDVLRIYGTANCQGFHSIDWSVQDMVNDTSAVAAETDRLVREVVEKDHSEVVLLACTTIAACVEAERLRTGAFSDLPYLNPSTLALKVSESLAQLSAVGRYDISRRGFYARP